ARLRELPFTHSFPTRRSSDLFWAALTLAFPAWGAHGVALFGEPKYPADYQAFDYVHPNAPKGGTLNLSIVSQNSSFDKFNPFSRSEEHTSELQSRENLVCRLL